MSVVYESFSLRDRMWLWKFKPLTAGVLLGAVIIYNTRAAGARPVLVDALAMWNTMVIAAEATGLRSDHEP